MNIRYPIYEGVYRILTSERGYRRTDNHTRGSLPSGRYPGGNRSLRTYLPQSVYPFTRTKCCQLRQGQGDYRGTVRKGG